MALQHLYSRIPARLSMFNRADSFDTFGRSEELGRVFIEKELGLYEDIRLTTKEASTLRKDKLDPMYFQYLAKSGELVQSCVSFISSDYTGERSSYLIHSLVMDPEEQKKVLANGDFNCFEPKLFEKDITKFNLTNPDSRPINDLPEIDYQGEKTEELTWLTCFNTNTLQRFIYTCLAAMCGKIKALYFTFGKEVENQSENALKVMNTISQLLPYHLRPHLSFVTSLNNQQRFSGIKVKCITEECGLVPASKGAMLNLRNGSFVGFKDEDVSVNYQVVEFFYSLISNDEIRREFFRYCQEAVEKVPELGQPTLKNINDLVFMFKVCCGKYEEMKVLPNDEKMVDFFTIYDKYRKALSDQYRINAMKTLKRYPATFKEIPKKVFSKVSKVYHTEPGCAKIVIMDIVLDLIHTDVMRDKLFVFIKNNYEDEEASVREKIVSDLCRVYYGEFLMPQILEFFTIHFNEENDQTKLDIMKTLVLTLRTKSVQNELFKFLDENYQYFTPEVKKIFYDELLENLVDGDEVSSHLLDILNKNIDSEPEALQERVQENLQHYVDKEAKKKNHPLTNLLVMKGGFGSDIVSSKIFAAGQDSAAFKEYVENVCSGNIAQRTSNILSSLKNQAELSKEEITGFLEQCKAVFTEGVNASVYDLMNESARLKEEIKGLGNKDAVKAAKAFSEEVFSKLVGTNARTFLAFKNMPGGAEAVQNYADDHPACKCEPGYEVVEQYLQLKKSSEKLDGQALADSMNFFLNSKELRVAAADYYAADTDKGLPMYGVVISAIKKGIADMQTVYFKLNPPNGDGTPSTDPVKTKEALDTILKLCKDIAASDACDALKQVFAPERCSLSGILATIVTSQGPAGKKIVEDAANAIGDGNIKEFITKQLASLEPPKTSFFDKLFKKKEPKEK